LASRKKPDQPKKPAPSRRQAGTKPVQNSPAKPSKRLIKAAATKSVQRKRVHTADWKKKNIKPPVQKRPSSGKKKIPKLTYHGKKVSDQLYEKIKKLRTQYIQQGKFLTNKEILARYMAVEKKLLKKKTITEKNDPLKLKSVISPNIDTQGYDLNEVVKAIMDFYEEVGNFTTSIIGFGEDKERNYGHYTEGLREVDVEIGLIWTAFDIIDAEEGLKSPMFRIFATFDRLTRVCFIDFNQTQFMSVDKDRVIGIIIDIKGTMEGLEPGHFQLSPEQEKELDQKEKDIQAEEKAAKKKKAKLPKKPAKSKKKAAKKKHKKPAPKYHRRKDGSRDMRYKENQLFAIRSEKAKKAWRKKKRAESAAAKQKTKKSSPKKKK
jgi:hypothetical protein